jgi:hypothetical protein
VQIRPPSPTNFHLSLGKLLRCSPVLTQASQGLLSQGSVLLGERLACGNFTIRACLKLSISTLRVTIFHMLCPHAPWHPQPLTQGLEKGNEWFHFLHYPPSLPDRVHGNDNVGRQVMWNFLCLGLHPETLEQNCGVNFLASCQYSQVIWTSEEHWVEMDGLLTNLCLGWCY